MKKEELADKIGQEVRVWDMAGYSMVKLISLENNFCTIERPDGKTEKISVNMILQ